VSADSMRLALHGGRPVAPRPVLPVWPHVSDAMQERLQSQAQLGLSIYDRSGVVKDFESAFADYVGVPLALATSSGTAALHSIYYGAGIGPGDEVICCDYGFFATITPLVFQGARPVFVDCAMDGTISVAAAEGAITGRTRAIVVTHMWGQPAQLDELQKLCERNGLLLFEDSSHAHGARYRGSVVGSIGTASAWSLQANKTVWAGEGGVLVTKDPELYERALLLGHFNRRALQDIPESSSNYAFAFTGTGLKYRAHPLGLALALPQIETLDQVIEGRHKSAAMLIDALSSIPGVQVVARQEPGTIHGYYALVALIDPAACGFDREAFIAAMQAENMHLVSAPRQMRSMAQYRLFASASAAGECGSQPEQQPLVNSRHITANAVQFFVPSKAADLTDDADVSIVAEAICKVGAALSRAPR
jgi:perosamine synthetase